MSKAVYLHNVTKKFIRPGVPLREHFADGGRHLNLGSGLSRYSKTLTVLEDVSFQVEEGEIFGILGSQRSGKSTLMHILATLLPADAGEIRIFGIDLIRRPAQAGQWVNRKSVSASFYKRLSPIENIINERRHESLKVGGMYDKAAELLIKLGFDDRMLHTPMEALDKADQQKVSTAKALLSRARLMLFDEPTRGLDPESRTLIHSLIQERRQQQGATILFTSQDELETRSLGDRAVILEGGMIRQLEKDPIENQGLEEAIRLECLEYCQ